MLLFNAFTGAPSSCKIICITFLRPRVPRVTREAYHKSGFYTRGENALATREALTKALLPAGIIVGRLMIVG
jgi:hypothetical protein